MGRENVLLVHFSKQVFQDRLQTRYLLDPFGTGCVEFSALNVLCLGTLIHWV